MILILSLSLLVGVRSTIKQFVMSCAVVVDGAVFLPAVDELVLAGENVLDTTLISSSEDSDSLDLDSLDSDFSLDCESSLSSLLESFSSELNLDCTESDESDESNRLRK